MKKILIILILIQTAFTHEISYHIGTGFGKNGGKMGLLFGLGYAYFFTPEWGITTGMEIATYNSEYKLKKDSLKYMTNDFDGDEFEFRSEISNYKEEQNARMLQIPIMARYQPSAYNQFHAAAGIKIGIPLSGYYISSANVKNSGYYGEEDYRYGEGWEFLGFGEFKKKNEKDLSLQTAFMLSAETGMKFEIAGRQASASVYFDYGLNSITKKQSADYKLIEYKGEEDKKNEKAFDLNSTLKSTQYAPMAIGIKISLKN